MTDEPPPDASSPFRFTRQHVGRIAAELAIIVSGILIALAADALLEQRAERKREAEILRTLAADLAESAAVLREDSRFAQTRSESLVWFISLHDSPSPRVPAERVQEVQVAANVTAAYAPILRAYDALIATGSLDLIQDDSILFGLADVNRRAEEYLDYRDQTTNLWLFTLMPIWLQHVEGRDADGLSAAIQANEFRAAMGQRAIFLRNTGTRGLALAERMEALATEIEAALGE